MEVGAMFKKLMPAIATMVMASLALITPLGASAQSWGSWRGNWRTSEGKMSLDYNSGTYDQDNGRVFFDVYELGGSYTLEGYWVEDGSAQKCRSRRDGSYHWGQIKFDFNDDFSVFEGAYGYCENPPTVYKWTGKR
jgi:hypothetical protein